MNGSLPAVTTTKLRLWPQHCMYVDFSQIVLIRPWIPTCFLKVLQIELSCSWWSWDHKVKAMTCK